MTIAVDMGRKATKTNKQTPGRRQSKTLILSTDVDQIIDCRLPGMFLILHQLCALLDVARNTITNTTDFVFKL